MNRRMPLALAAALALPVGCSDTHQPSSYPQDDAGSPEGPAAGEGGGGGAAAPGGEEAGRPDGGGDAAPDGRPGVDVTVGGGADVAIVPDGAIAEAPTRQRRRMDLDQLSASLSRVMDGISWTARRGNNDVDQFVELASTLGKPDFVQITTEDLEPSALFQKFLDDAARSVCDKALARDAERPAATRLLAREGESDTDTLLRLLLRFHGRRLSADSPDLEHWRWLVQSTTHVTGDAQEAWRAVCVALVTHPDFYSY